MSKVLQRFAIEAVLSERARQDEQWGGADHDAMHDSRDWVDYIEKQLRYVRNGYGVVSPDLPRERFVKIAALAVAAIEAYDRK